MATRSTSKQPRSSKNPSKKNPATKPKPKQPKPKPKPKLIERPLNVRQERFCELVASGKNQAEAYVEAGSKVTKLAARNHAARLAAKDSIKARIAQLRAPKTREILSTRDDKRSLLRHVFENPTVKMQDRLRAIELDAKLAGQFEPDRTEIDVGPRTLQSIRERAETIHSAMVAKYSRK